MFSTRVTQWFFLLTKKETGNNNFILFYYSYTFILTKNITIIFYKFFKLGLFVNKTGRVWFFIKFFNGSQRITLLFNHGANFAVLLNRKRPNSCDPVKSSIFDRRDLFTQRLDVRNFSLHRVFNVVFPHDTL